MAVHSYTVVKNNQKCAVLSERRFTFNKERTEKWNSVL